MKKLEVVMGCSACKWKITTDLHEVGIKDFQIDMNTNTITFNDDVNLNLAIKTIKNLNYYCEEIEEFDLSDEELLMLEHEFMQSGYEG